MRMPTIPSDASCVFLSYICRSALKSDHMMPFIYNPSRLQLMVVAFRSDHLATTALERTRLCKSAGILGFKTNHSLRATTATRLHQSGIDEQLIMERTGHQSTEGVRSYKRTSQQQSEDISDILHCSRRACTTSHSVVHVGEHSAAKESSIENHQQIPATLPGNFHFHS